MNTNQLTATWKVNPTSLCDHEYYGPLIDSYIKSILKSGLLLDEDLEVLLSISKFRHFPERNAYRPSLSLLASIISALSAPFLATKLRMPLLVIPPFIASVYFTLIEYKREKRKQDNVGVVDRLLEVIIKLQKFTKNVIRYMKTRYDLGKTDKSSLVLHGKNVGEFMNVFLQTNSNILTFLSNNLNTFTTYSPELQEDFKSLEHLNYSNIFESENFYDTEDCLSCTQKVYDINVLIFSKLISYIGILFNSTTLREHSCSTLINETLHDIVKTLEHYHDTTKKQFLFLRHSSNKKSEIHLQSEMNKRKSISTKLEATLISSVNNLSVILEKSQIVLDKLENKTEKDLPHIGNALVDLRNHTFATYESLDLLCRLYGILSNATVNQTAEAANRTSKMNTISSETVPTVSYDDDSEPVDEKFELYIGAEEPIDEHPKPDYEDHSSAYLSLMLQELKQSLKQHERFIEAKNKRGDEDEDEMELETRLSKAQKQSPPKFNLNQLRDNLEQDHALVRSEFVKENTKSEVVPNLPAPPPPPLPPFCLNDLEQETGQINARSMLENIKVLSSQRNTQEDVFGDSDEDSNCSD
ncbi:uncharacterized protein LOC108905952 [Anoplophora glabripennis]|uniref:uncharacterized protein LOC108905952 n=1 Tax=Anoplophora glabripennis TaxID=217634 RepID=UPI0008759323|nr:uncharacterized protein LOC108905952 [Anoplophora glabripennis]